MAQTKYSFSRKGDKEKKDLSLDSEEKVAKGDVVSLKDGKRAKVSDVVLNLETGVHDVTIEDIEDAKPAVSTADGNEPNPESKAVKDVVFDPMFSPKIVDAVAESNERLDRSHDRDERRKVAAEKAGTGVGSSPAGPYEKAAAATGGPATTTSGSPVRR